MKRAWFALLPLAVTACNPWTYNAFTNFFPEVEDAVYYQRSTLVDAPPPADGKLKVMNWNIKFGGGRIDFFFDCFDKDRSLMKRSEVIANMDAVVAKINELNPDILVLQEVDVDSKRSAHIDQLQYILDRTQLNYGAYATQWRVDFIPSDDLGQMDDGNAVLSRWPLRDAERLALKMSKELPEYKRQYYLKRNILSLLAEVPGYPDLRVLAIHADAYSKDGTKKTHIDRFKAEIDEAADRGESVLAAGDLNALPPGSEKTSGFDDTVCTDEEFIADDYSKETQWLVPLFNDYADVIPLADYQADNAKYFSHTVRGPQHGGYWNRRLDYVFTNLSWEAGSGVVHQDTMELSDHAPVTGTLELVQ